MGKLSAGDLLPDFTYDTPFESGLRFGETAAGQHKTALVFLRYYGCTLCQYDIHQFAAHYPEIISGGGRFLVVLQSDPEKLAGQLQKDSLPFPIICDPQKELYRQFDIAPAKSKAALAGLATGMKVLKATKAGFKHGDYEGDELQLPAVFVTDASLKVTFAHYGKDAGDVPAPDRLAELLR